MQFNEISKTRAPFVFVEFSNENAITPVAQKYKVLLMGEGSVPPPSVPSPSTPTGPGTTTSITAPQTNSVIINPVGQVVQIKSAKDAAQFGSDSMLGTMIKTFFGTTRAIGFEVYAVAVTPDKVGDILAGLEQFHIIAFPYVTTDALTKLRDTLANRWKADVNLEGFAFVTTNGKLPVSLNSPYLSAIAWNGLNDPAQVTSAVAAQVAESASKDPSMPFSTLPLPMLTSAAQKDRWDFKKRSDLLSAGISTLKEDSGGLVRIERLITTYTGNGDYADESYLDVNTPLTLSFLRFSFRNYWGSKYSRAKLSKEAPRTQTGTVVVYPALAKSEVINWYKDMIDLGVCQNNLDAFRESVSVEISKSNLAIYLEPELMDQLIGTSVKMAFRE